MPKVSVEQVVLVTQGRGDGREGAKVEGDNDIDREAGKGENSPRHFSFILRVPSSVQLKLWATPIFTIHQL